MCTICTHMYKLQLMPCWPHGAKKVNRDLSRIQEWCNHWCTIMNPNKTKALVDSISRTVNPPHGDLVLSGVSICGSPNLDIFGLKFNSRPTFEEVRAWYCLSCLSKNWHFEVGEACLCGHLCVTSLLLAISSLNPWVLFSRVWVCCWMLSTASWAPGVFGGQVLPWSDFLVVVSSTSCYCTVYVVQGYFELESFFV